MDFIEYPIYTGTVRREIMVVTFKVHHTFLEKINLLAKELGIERSILIRAALLRALDEPPSKEYLVAAAMLASRPYEISIWYKNYITKEASTFI